MLSRAFSYCTPVRLLCNTCAIMPELVQIEGKKGGNNRNQKDKENP